MTPICLILAAFIVIIDSISNVSVFPLYFQNIPVRVIHVPSQSPGDLPVPGVELVSLTSPALAGRFFTTSTMWEAQDFQREEGYSQNRRAGVG